MEIRPVRAEAWRPAAPVAVPKPLYHLLLSLLLTLSLLSTAGCARYTAAPLDPEAQAAAWALIDARTATEAVSAALAEDRLPDVAGDGFDLSDGVTLREAEVAALFFNPALRRARHEAGVAATAMEHAGRWEDPELGIEAGAVLSDVDAPLILGGDLSVTIPISGRPALRQQLAAAQHDAALAALVGAEWGVRREIRAGWLSLAALRARVSLLEQATAELEELLAASASFRSAQAMTVVDERRLQIELEETRYQLREAGAAAELQRLSLVALMGLHPAHPWRLLVAADALTPPREAAEPLSRERLLRHPGLRVVLAAYVVAERELELEVRKQYPDLRIGLGARVEDDLPRLVLGLGILPLPLWNANRGGIAAAGAERVVAGARVREVVQALVARHRVALHHIETAQTRLDWLEDTLAPLSDAQVRDARMLTGLGQLDPYLLTDTLQRARETRLRLLDARVTLALAHARLDGLRGPGEFQPAVAPADPQGSE